jgi:DNA-binding CsgD family transcriptional regulator/N-acetylneuraminic acid mutarotase
MAEYGEPLSEREIEILQLVATGVTNRQVAHQLDISVNTVKVHLRNVFTKLGAESRTEATMIAVQEGWVQVEGAAQAETQRAPYSEMPRPAPVAPPPSLPWTRRILLIGALLLAVSGIALTWPTESQEENGDGLPFNQPGEQPQLILSRSSESLWQEHAQMPTRRAHLALAAADGRMFAIAGQGPDGVTGAVEIYDPADDIWTRGRDKPIPVTHVSGATIGTHVYVPGGCDDAGTPTRTVEVYDVAADTWQQASPLPKALCAYALTTQGGRLYLFGGWDGKQYAADTYIYDPQTDTWNKATPMPIARGFAAAAPLGGRLYVVGGYNDEKELTTCTIYEPETDRWQECAPLTVGRGGLGLVNLNDNLYAVGGGGWSSYLGFNERYSPADDAWSAIETPLIEEWRSPGVVVIEDAIYVIGGWSGDYLSLNQSYDPFPFRVFIPVSQK